MKTNLFLKVFCFLGLVGFSGLLPVRGVIVATGDGSQNSSSSGLSSELQTAWGHVGRVGSGSGVFLGSYPTGHWVLTGWHVAEGAFILNSTSYAAVSGSSVRVENEDDTGTDLRLFQIVTSPGLGNLNIPEEAPAVGTSVVMMGQGRNRAAGGTLWTDEWQETSNLAEAEYAGYKWASGRTKRWGTNTIDTFQSFNAGFGDVEGFVTDFDLNTNEGQGSSGDSGGGVFTVDGDLVGLMLAIGDFSGQPGSTAVFGNNTFSADLTAYKPFIEATVVPEPSSLLLLLGGLVLLIRRRARDEASPS